MNSSKRKIKLYYLFVLEAVISAANSIGQESNSNLTATCKGRQKTAGGYRWAYCDENGNILDKSGRKK
jgi:hypothetical protein